MNRRLVLNSSAGQPTSGRPMLALQRNADGVAVRSFPGKTPETNVPAQVPV
jgi:hypothetical protein